MAAGVVRRIGAGLLEGLAETARMWRLAMEAARQTLVGPFRGRPIRFRETVRQVLRSGNESLGLVVLIATLIGTILALQSAYQLRTFGAVHLVVDLVAISVTRELAPLMTAILVAGRAGSSIAAELGTMKVSEEIDALTVIGLDPISYLVVPRIVGLLIAVPCLTLFADLVGILGGTMIGVFVLGIGAGTYLADSLAILVAEDIWGGVLKGFVFGGIIGLVACQKGLATRGGADEVGKSTTSTVVRSIVLIIVADLFVTALLYLRG